ncbi:MAG: hypothetical protein R3Y36_05025, partial [Spirochaetales bacterium]
NKCLFSIFLVRGSQTRACLAFFLSAEVKHVLVLDILRSGKPNKGLFCIFYAMFADVQEWGSGTRAELV